MRASLSAKNYITRATPKNTIRIVWRRWWWWRYERVKEKRRKFRKTRRGISWVESEIAQKTWEPMREILEAFFFFLYIFFIYACCTTTKIIHIIRLCGARLVLDLNIMLHSRISHHRLLDDSLKRSKSDEIRSNHNEENQRQFKNCCTTQKKNSSESFSFSGKTRRTSTFCTRESVDSFSIESEYSRESEKFSLVWVFI